MFKAMNRGPPRSLRTPVVPANKSLNLKSGNKPHRKHHSTNPPPSNSSNNIPSTSATPASRSKSIPPWADMQIRIEKKHHRRGNVHTPSRKD